jgi:hypothetical protein
MTDAPTLVRLLPPWRETSAAQVPATMPEHMNQLPLEILRATKIWDALAVLSERNHNPNADRARAYAVGCWYVFAPWMHPLWSWHFVILCHLRTVDGFAPPKRVLPNVTHEVVAFSLDPRTDPSVEGMRAMSPPDICQQFDAANDAHARVIVEDLLEEMLRGRLSCDRDFRPVWRHLLCDCDERPMAPT